MSHRELQAIRDRLSAAANYSAEFSAANARLTWYAYTENFAIPDTFAVEQGFCADRPVEWIRRRDIAADKVLLYFHGGGYVCGSIASHRPIICELANSFCGTVGSLEYRLAPEHPFPAAIDDAVAAYENLLGQGRSPRHIAFAGESAGAGLAMAALLALRKRGTSLPAAALCISPWTDLTNSGDSVAANSSRDPIVFRGAIDATRDLYLAGHAATDPLASPIFGDFKDLPPLLIQVGSTEVLLDDALRLARTAARADVEVQLQVWPEMLHAWHIFSGELEEGRRASEGAALWLNAKLGTPRP